MSALLMGLVWGIELSPPDQAVMLALADHGKDDGTDIYPSVELIAWKTGKSQRQVQYILRGLERRGLLVAIAHGKGGRGHAIHYEMHLETGTLKPALARVKGAAVIAPFTEDTPERVQSSAKTAKGCNPAPERVQSSARKGAIQRLKGAIAIAPEPLETLLEPSEKIAHTRDGLSAEKKENAEAEPEPEAEAPPIPPPPPSEPLMYHQFQRAYLKRHGQNTPSQEIHSAYSQYLYEFDKETANHD